MALKQCEVWARASRPPLRYPPPTSSAKGGRASVCPPRRAAPAVRAVPRSSRRAWSCPPPMHGPRAKTKPNHHSPNQPRARRIARGARQLTALAESRHGRQQPGRPQEGSGAALALGHGDDPRGEARQQRHPHHAPRPAPLPRPLLGAASRRRGALSPGPRGGGGGAGGGAAAGPAQVGQPAAAGRARGAASQGQRPLRLLAPREAAARRQRWRRGPGQARRVAPSSASSPALKGRPAARPRGGTWASGRQRRRFRTNLRGTTARRRSPPSPAAAPRPTPSRTARWALPAAGPSCR